MRSLIVNSLWLIAVDPHRGGSISLRPYPTPSRFPSAPGGYAANSRTGLRASLPVRAKSGRKRPLATRFLHAKPTGDRWGKSVSWIERPCARSVFDGAF